MSALVIRTESGSVYELDLDGGRLRKAKTTSESAVNTFPWMEFGAVQAIRRTVGFVPIELPGDLQLDDQLLATGIPGDGYWVMTSPVVEIWHEELA